MLTQVSRLGRRSAAPVVTRAHTHTGLRFHLGRSATHSMDCGREGLRIMCHDGAVWLTQSGDGSDYHLMAGQEMTLMSGGKIVMQGLEESIVEIG